MPLFMENNLLRQVKNINPRRGSHSQLWRVAKTISSQEKTVRWQSDAGAARGGPNAFEGHRPPWRGSFTGCIENVQPFPGLPM